MQELIIGQNTENKRLGLSGTSISTSTPPKLQNGTEEKAGGMQAAGWGRGWGKLSSGHSTAVAFILLPLAAVVTHRRPVQADNTWSVAWGVAPKAHL